MARVTPSIAIAAIATASVCVMAQPAIECIEPDAATGSSKAVVVEGMAPLVHTTMILPMDTDGELVGADDAQQQTAYVLDSIVDLLRISGSGADRAARLNVYAAQDNVISIIEQQIALTFEGPHKPAVTYVVGRLPHPGALVAMDAVGVCVEGAEGWTVRPELYARPEWTHTAVLPAGRAVYISGQAEPGDTLGEAAQNTLRALKRTLVGLQIGELNVVHVKCFFQPMEAASEVDEAIDAFFELPIIPPVTYVEWTNNTPIEIELIASASEDAATQAEGSVSYLTPPGMTASPVFSRVTVIDSDRRVYISGLTGNDTSSAESEVRSLYGELGRILELAGSDMDHLVKATYYCATDATGAALNQVRPDFYDPERPPAASKALVRGTGRAGKGIMVDMIAVGR